MHSGNMRLCRGGSIEDSSTNRDLYLAISNLIADKVRAPDRELEEYLRAMLGVVRSRRGVDALTAEEFVGVLAKSFTADPLPFDPRWGDEYRAGTEELDGIAKCEATILQQVVDLREMRESGILDGKWIGLGVDAPRGGRWYNFDPRQYLECAAAGAIGGWEPGDPTGRNFVPGPVAVMNPDGSIGSADPHELERSIRTVVRVTWEQFAEFLVCGQVYE